MPLVSMFANAKIPTGAKYFEPAEIVEWIRNGRWSSLITQLNSISDPKQQAEFKTTKIPGVVWQGKFSERKISGLIEHSGLVALDFDKMDETTLLKYRDILKNDEYTHILFRSPRQNGLKVVIRIPAEAEHHKAYLAGLRKRYESQYYDHFDDVSRLCFVSHDPEIYYNEHSKIFTEKGIVKSSDASPIDTVNIPEDIKGTFLKLVKWADKKEGYVDGNKHTHLICLFGACNRYGLPKDDSAVMAYEVYSKIEGLEPVNFRDFQDRANSVYSLYSNEFCTQAFDTEPHQIQVPEIKYQEPEAELKPSKVTFPISVFPAAIQQYIGVLNSSLNYSKDFLAVANMFTIATLNGNTYKLRVKNGWISPTVFWFAVVGDPGTMKSHPISTTISPLSKIDKDSKFIYDADVKEWEKEKKGDRPQFRQILISDYTLEALHQVHSHNRRGIGMYKDELVGFLNDMNKYRKGSDEQFWLESFNNKSYIVNRVSKEPLYIEDTMINIIGSIQPTVLSRVVKDHGGNGLIDRFLYTTSETNIIPLSKNDIDPSWMKWWNDSICFVNQAIKYNNSDDTNIVELDYGALDRIVEIDTEFCNMQMSDDATFGTKNYISKMKTYLPRFALLMFIYDRMFNGVSEVVTVDHIDRAKNIVTYFIESSKQIFGDADKREEISGVVSKLNGMTKVEKIIQLSKKGYKNVEIAKIIGSAPSYVSKIIKYNLKNNR